MWFCVGCQSWCRATCYWWDTITTILSVQPSNQCINNIDPRCQSIISSMSYCCYISNMGVSAPWVLFIECSNLPKYSVFRVVWEMGRISVSFVLAPGSGCFTNCHANATSHHLWVDLVASRLDNISRTKSASVHASRHVYLAKSKLFSSAFPFKKCDFKGMSLFISWQGKLMGTMGWWYR